MSIQEARVFSCPEHGLSIISDQVERAVSSRGSAGQRDPSCAKCEKAVDDAFRFAGIDW